MRRVIGLSSLGSRRELQNQLSHRIHWCRLVVQQPLRFVISNKRAFDAESSFFRWVDTSVSHSFHSVIQATSQFLSHDSIPRERLRKFLAHFQSSSRQLKQSMLVHARNSGLPTHTRLKPILQLHECLIAHQVHYQWVASAALGNSWSWASQTQLIEWP